MATDKKSFLLYCDLIHTVEKLNDEKAGALFKHILRYVNDQNPTAEDFIIELAFEPIKQSLKRDLQRYEAIKERNRINGLRGGRPKNEQLEENPNEPKKPTGLSGNPKNPDEPKKADSGSGSDSDSGSGSGSTVVDNLGDKSPTVTKKKFIKPTLEEIQAYCLERQNMVNPTKFLNYYESNGWKVGKNSMKDWKAAVRNWENNDQTPVKNGQRQTNKEAISAKLAEVERKFRGD